MQVQPERPEGKGVPRLYAADQPVERLGRVDKDWLEGQQKEASNQLSLEGMQRELGLSPFHVDPEEFAEWFDSELLKPLDTREHFVIPNLPLPIREALGTEADSLIFSHQTLKKQRIEHPEITHEAYSKVLNKLKDFPEAYPTRPLHVGVIVEAERPYLVVLKAVKGKPEVYMVSLHISRNSYLRQIRKNKK